ncbi:hypothetical protein [Streptomyces brasiliensis]|uniref:Uncharacterized protein n=1 Tax=Streptomyces brasiliensis TaxID=1954 RepID=A0A917L8F5_9ACTN|nr:hypothetical protein [Streptomyces brasiliensis]GGJ48586.1 hypothetical protein GCM10010121_069640 [Streptomyces brasiliensis]
MYNMRADQLTTENGPVLLWHVLDHDDFSLCGRPLTRKATVTPEGAMEREDYCHLCMEVVAAVVAASLAGAPTDAQRGERGA